MDYSAFLPDPTPYTYITGNFITVPFNTLMCANPVVPDGKIRQLFIFPTDDITYGEFYNIATMLRRSIGNQYTHYWLVGLRKWNPASNSYIVDHDNCLIHSVRIQPTAPLYNHVLTYKKDGVVLYQTTFSGASYFGVGSAVSMTIARHRYGYTQGTPASEIYTPYQVAFGVSPIGQRIFWPRKDIIFGFGVVSHLPTNRGGELEFRASAVRPTTPFTPGVAGTKNWKGLVWDVTPFTESPIFGEPGSAACGGLEPTPSAVEVRAPTMTIPDALQLYPCSPYVKPNLTLSGDFDIVTALWMDPAPAVQQIASLTLHKAPVSDVFTPYIKIAVEGWRTGVLFNPKLSAYHYTTPTVATFPFQNIMAPTQLTDTTRIRVIRTGTFVDVLFWSVPLNAWVHATPTGFPINFGSEDCELTFGYQSYATTGLQSYWAITEFPDYTPTPVKRNAYPHWYRGGA